MPTMAEHTTGSIYTSGATGTQPPANHLQAQIAQLQEDVRDMRKLVLWTLIFTAIVLVAVIVAAVSSSYSALVIYRVVEGLRQAFGR
jgi:predicted MFS family arabinose efflux permease